MDAYCIFNSTTSETALRTQREAAHSLPGFAWCCVEVVLTKRQTQSFTALTSQSGAQIARHGPRPAPAVAR